MDVVAPASLDLATRTGWTFIGQIAADLIDREVMTGTFGNIVLTWFLVTLGRIVWFKRMLRLQLSL